jgi:hypothetical protein
VILQHKPDAQVLKLRFFRQPRGIQLELLR